MAYDSQAEGEGPQSGHAAFSPLSILRTIWKRRFRIVLGWVLFSAVAVVAVRMLPTIYLSESLVLIDSQKIPEKFVSATVASDLEDRIASIREMLLSSGELKKIIDDFGLYQEKRKSHFEEEILDMMRKDISISLDPMVGSSSKRTTAFRIGYQGRDPQIVMQVANRLTDLYVEQNLKTRESQAAGTSAFLDTQLREAKKRLDELEASVSSYKVQHNGELPQQEQTLSAALSRLQTELEANRDAINRAQQTRVILESNLNSMEATLSAQTQAWELLLQASAPAGPFLSPDQAGKAPQKKTSEVLQEELAALRAHYGDRHPDVIRKQSEIESVKRVEQQRQGIGSEATTESQPSSPRITAPAVTPQREPAELARMREQVAGLRSQIRGSDKELQDRQAEQQRILHDIAQYQSRIERLPVREQEMAQITRDQEMSKENYKSLLDKKTAAEMALDMERRQQSEHFTVVDRARVPQVPIKPKRPLLYGLGSALALALGLLMGFSAELRQNVVLGEWEFPEGTPVLARLPYIEAPLDQGWRKSNARKRWFGRKKPLTGVPLGV
jgi:polysaccharide chain length determinant protein (PEP-CTERM system associated)